MLARFAFTQTSHGAGSIGYEYGTINYKNELGATYGFAMHRLTMFDTTGGLTAGIRGGLNKSVSQSVAESNAKEGMGDAAFATYKYSWSQPAPIPTDGDLWALVLGSEGNPIIDPIAPSTTDGNKKRSVLGVEFSSVFYKLEMAPVSIATAWGFKGYMFTYGRDSNMAFSVPLEAVFSSLVYANTLAYVNLGFGPYGYLASDKPKYNHVEIGLHYSIGKDWLLNSYYRMTKDEYEKSKNIYVVDNTQMVVGFKYQF